MYSLASFFPLLIKYKYLILFPLLIAEGPILTLMASFLASPAGGGVMNVAIVFVVVVIADITGDTMYYSIGRFGKNHIGWLGQKIGLTPRRLNYLDDFFVKHGTKTLILGKISHGLGWPAMVGAGAAKMKYPRFLFVNSIVSFFKSIILVALGYYYGVSYIELSHHVSRVGMTITTIVLLFILIYFFQIRNKGKNKLKDLPVIEN